MKSTPVGDETLSLFAIATSSERCLSDILTNIFGDAEIEEWFEYGGAPGYFRILTTNPNVSGDTLEQFRKTAQNVKRLSAWLEEVLVDLGSSNMALKQGFALYDHTEIEFTQEG